MSTQHLPALSMQYSTEIIHLTITAAGIEYYRSPADSARLDWLQINLFVSMWCHTVGPDPSEELKSENSFNSIFSFRFAQK